MDKGARIWVAGSSTFIGSAIHGALAQGGYHGLIPGPDPELTNSAAVEGFMAAQRPEYVFLAAGPAHGIVGNLKFPAELIHQNLLIECNLIHGAHSHGVKKLIYLASNCCYPRDCAQPMRPQYILTGPLEPTNEPYSVARIAGLKLVQAYRKQYGCDFISAIPANSFGPRDDFSPEDSHVVGALMRRMHKAKQAGEPVISVWGTGRPRREFMYVGDLASAAIFAMQGYEGDEPINLGPGGDHSIADLARAVQKATGYEGGLEFDPTKPDGMPKKLLDTTVLRELGWRPSVDLDAGLSLTYDWFRKNAV